MADATLTLNLRDVVKLPFSARRAKVWATLNVDEFWDEDGNLRVDAGKATVDDSGLVTITGVPIASASTNPTSGVQLTVHYEISDVRLPAQRGVNRARGKLGPFTITGDADLKDLADEQAIPPTYLSTVTAALDAKVADAEAERVAAEAARAGAEAAAATAVDVSNIDTPDSLVATLVSDEVAGPLTTAALSATFVGRATTAFQPPVLQRVTSTVIGSGPRFVDEFGGYLWAYDPATGAIARSVDGSAWTDYTATWTTGWGFISRIVPTTDGEVLAMSATQIRKSSGWAVGGASVSWSASKVTPNGSCVFNGFGLSGGDPANPGGEECQKLILVEYNSSSADWDQSRYAHVSLDAGDTWTVVYDSEALHGPAASDASHLHCAGYSPWADQFVLGEGHGPAGGIYASINNGATWAGPLNVESTAETATNAPTVAIATDTGWVFGSDNAENGLFGMRYRDNPAEQKLVRTWALKTGRAGLIAFAQRGWRDPVNGLVYVTFRSEYADTPITLAAGTPSSGGLVYQEPTLPVTGGADRFVAVARIDDDTLFFYGEVLGVAKHFTGTLTLPGATSPDLLDAGNVRGGKADPSSAASGPGSQAANRGTAVGPFAKATGQDSGAVGNGAEATASLSFAMPTGKAGNVGSVAYPGETTDTGYQVKVGQRFHRMKERTAPALPAADEFDFYARDDGNGRTQVVVQFATGAVQVLATQHAISRIVTGSATLTSTGDRLVVVNAAADPTITLPDAAGRNGLTLTVKNVGTAAGGATIVSNGGKTIDGAASLVLPRWGKATLISDGANWLTI